MFAASDLSRRTEHDHPGRVVDSVILNQGSATSPARVAAPLRLYCFVSQRRADKKPPHSASSRHMHDTWPVCNGVFR